MWGGRVETLSRGDLVLSLVSSRQSILSFLSFVFPQTRLLDDKVTAGSCFMASMPIKSCTHIVDLSFIFSVFLGFVFLCL